MPTMDNPVIVIHDRAASLATFIEITFAINIALATYDKFRDHLRAFFGKKIESYIAVARATEGKVGENGRRIKNLKERIDTISQRHESRQEFLCRLARGVSILMALMCLVVLYWDKLEFVGYQVAFLISPLPAYVILSYLLVLYSCYRVRRINAKFVSFIQTFENSVSQEIREGLQSLQEPDKEA
jgi:hypothetical protein